MNRELEIPSLVEHDPNALELLRVWTAFGYQHMNVRISTLQDPAAWGLIMMDVMRLIAKAYQEQTGSDPIKALARMLAFLEAEIDTPTNKLSSQ